MDDRLDTTGYLSACDRGDVKALMRHQAAGGSLTLVDSDGYTGYHRSAYHNQPACIQFLLDKGTDNFDAIGTARGWRGKTALMVAAAKGNLECVQLLLECGADASLHDPCHRTAVILAQDDDHAEVARTISEHLVRRLAVGLPPSASDQEVWMKQAVQAATQKADESLPRREQWQQETVRRAEKAAQAKGGALVLASAYATNAAQSAAADGQARAEADVFDAVQAAVTHLGQEACEFRAETLRQERERSARALEEAQAAHEAHLTQVQAAHEARLTQVQAAHEAQERQVTVSAFVQGLSYSRRQIVDLSDASFGIVDSAQLRQIAGYCCDLEALFLSKGSSLDEGTLHMFRDLCPQAVCLVLGCELAQDAYLGLRAQYEYDDAEVATALNLDLPPDNGVPEHSAGLCRVLDLTDGIFAQLTDAGFAEIPKFCSDVTAVFLPTDSKITSTGLQEFRRQCPSICCLALGAEMQRAQLLRLLENVKKTQILDLTGDACGKLTDSGLRELAGICETRGSFSLKAAVFPQQLKQTAEDALTELQSLHPSAHFVFVGDEIRLSVRQQALSTKQELDRIQGQLKSVAVVEQTACDDRDAARQQFIVAAEDFFAAFAEGSTLADHLARLTESAQHSDDLGGLSEIQKWQRVKAEAQQLAVLAAECKHVVESSEPERSKEVLIELQVKDQKYRQEFKTCQARIEYYIVESEKSASSQQARTTAQTTPEQQQARNTLLEHGISNWSEEQVQEWIGVLGLTPENTVAVQQALAADKTDGEDLESYSSAKQWTKRLKKSGVENCAEVAEQAMVLHEQALGGAASQGKLAVAQAGLAAARTALRDNRLKMRSQVVHLVSLASQHFPELKEHKDVLAFMGSDGLEASDRRKITDYDDVKPLITGRNELLRAKYDGADVCLKAFPLQGDMGAYKREFLRVQRLRHPCIIDYTAAFEDNGTMYLEMEYYNHGSLRNWMETTKADAVKKRAVLRQVLLALACVHNQGIVHSDIKGEVRVHQSIACLLSFTAHLFRCNSRSLSCVALLCGRMC